MGSAAPDSVPIPPYPHGTVPVESLDIVFRAQVKVPAWYRYKEMNSNITEAKGYNNFIYILHRSHIHALSMLQQITSNSL